MEQNSVKHTALSAGLIVFELLNVPRLTQKVTKIFPVITDEATAPYVFYRRVGMPIGYTKQGNKDVAQVEVYAVCRTYEESVDIAEEVRNALEGMSGKAECGLVLSRCSLVDASEDWVDDAFIQKLIFNVEI